MFIKRLMCAALIASLILSGCAPRRAPTTSGDFAPPHAEAPVPLPVDTTEAEPYDLRNTDAVRHPGTLHILCKEGRFAKAAHPVYLLPDLPQIREYFAGYYGFFVEKTGVSDTRISERFRELYAPYTRTTKAAMEKNPPQISFERLPAGSYIVFFAPQAEQPASEKANATLGDVFMLRIQLAGAKTTTLVLDEMDIPLPGGSDHKVRNFIPAGASLPPGYKEADVIRLQNGGNVLWPEGAVLRLPIVPAPPPPPAEPENNSGSAVMAAILFPLAILFAFGAAIIDKETDKDHQHNRHRRHHR